MVKGLVIWVFMYTHNTLMWSTFHFLRIAVASAREKTHVMGSYLTILKEFEELERGLGRLKTPILKRSERCRWVVIWVGAEHGGEDTMGHGHP